MTKYFLQGLLLTTALIAWCGCTPPVPEDGDQGSDEQAEAKGGCDGCGGNGEACDKTDCEGCDLCDGGVDGTTVPAISDLDTSDWLPLPPMDVGTTSGTAIDLPNTTTSDGLFELPEVPVDAPPLPDLGDDEDTDWILIPPAVIDTPGTTTGNGLFDLPPAGLDLPGVTSGN